MMHLDERENRRLSTWLSDREEENGRREKRDTIQFATDPSISSCSPSIRIDMVVPYVHRGNTHWHLPFPSLSPIDQRKSIVNPKTKLRSPSRYALPTRDGRSQHIYLNTKKY